jgi:hypothetical protein
MEVLNREAQHLSLLEAVQNHTPQVVVVDEVGTKQVGWCMGLHTPSIYMKAQGKAGLFMHCAENGAFTAFTAGIIMCTRS